VPAPCKHVASSAQQGQSLTDCGLELRVRRHLASALAALPSWYKPGDAVPPAGTRQARSASAASSHHTSETPRWRLWCTTSRVSAELLLLLLLDPAKCQPLPACLHLLRGYLAWLSHRVSIPPLLLLLLLLLVASRLLTLTPVAQPLPLRSAHPSPSGRQAVLP
jgi:hypothetical protein